MLHWCSSLSSSLLFIAVLVNYYNTVSLAASDHERLETLKRPFDHAVILLFKGVILDQRYQLRLHGGQNQYVGEAQVYVNGTWGAFCAETDREFKFEDAHELCKALGFQTTEEFYRINSTKTPLLVDDLSCPRGRQIVDIFGCYWTWHVEDNSCNVTAGVVCSDGKHFCGFLKL